MRSVCSTAISFIISFFVFSSCTSNSGKNKPGEADNGKPFNSAELLKYNAKDADPKIDAFMQHLHKVANFNGNVLVAKKGKIIYQNALGWANHLTRDSLKLGSQFELASSHNSFAKSIPVICLNP